MTSIDKIVDSFPHPTITPIIGKPTYEIIRPMHLFLNANAASVQWHLGNGRLDLLFLTVLPAVFNSLSHVPFVSPPHPGPDRTITYNATAAQILALRHSHAITAKLHRKYDSTSKALK